MNINGLESEFYELFPEMKFGLPIVSDLRTYFKVEVPFTWAHHTIPRRGVLRFIVNEDFTVFFNPAASEPCKGEAGEVDWPVLYHISQYKPIYSLEKKLSAAFESLGWRES